jgi:hypothetical protein
VAAGALILLLTAGAGPALAGIGLSLVGIYLVSRPPVRKPGP